MLTSHLADHIITKVQGIESAKLMYDWLIKLYRTTTELEEFILMKKLFNISYASAGNMHKYISQMDDMIKALERLDIAIDLQILRSLIINQLGAHFQEFQAQKQDFNLSKVSLEKLFSQMLRENEVQYYQKEK